MVKSYLCSIFLHLTLWLTGCSHKQFEVHRTQALLFALWLYGWISGHFPFHSLNLFSHSQWNGLSSRPKQCREKCSVFHICFIIYILYPINVFKRHTRALWLPICSLGFLSFLRGNNPVCLSDMKSQRNGTACRAFPTVEGNFSHLLQSPWV